MIEEIIMYYFEIYGVEGLGFIYVLENILFILIYNFGSIVVIFIKYGKDLMIVDVGRFILLVIVFNLWNDLMLNVKGIYFMGGVFLEVGNVMLLVEVNVYGDLIVSKIVFY